MSLDHKSQSALEYMATYGWAILIIVIVAGVLYSLGVFSPSNAASNTVIGFSGFNVQAQCIQGGALEMQITNGLGYTVNITKVNTTSNSGQSMQITNAPVLLSSQVSTSYYVPNACPLTTGSRYSVSTTLTYTEPGQTFSGPYFSTGTSSGSVAAETVPAQAAYFTYTLHSKIGVRSSASLNITGSITIGAWYNLAANITGCYNEGIVSKATSEFPGTGGNNIGGYNLFLGCGMSGQYTNGPQNASGWSSGGPIPNSGRWVYVTGEKDGSLNRATFFINGVTETVNDVSTWSLTKTPVNLTIGFSYAFADAFNGSISDVQIYNTALSATQISRIYGEGLGGAPLSNAGLVGWWPLDGNAMDFSGNGNNGVATNVQWVSP
jgi:hypothetical protein